MANLNLRFTVTDDILKEVSAKVKNESSMRLSQAVLDGANDIREGAIQAIDFYHAIATGRLRRSIRVEPPMLGPHRYSVIADPVDPKTGHGYSKFVEFGTSKLFPRPFMQEAIANTADEIRTKIVKAIDELLNPG